MIYSNKEGTMKYFRYRFIGLIPVWCWGWISNIRYRYRLYKMKSYKYKYGIGDTVICTCKSFWNVTGNFHQHYDRHYNKPCIILSIVKPGFVPVPQYNVLIGDEKIVLAEVWMKPIIKDSDDVQ